MKKSKNIEKNKIQLENYLNDFHPIKKNEALIKFENFNFECGTTSFNDEISLYRVLKPISKLKILNEYYNTNKEHILSLLIPKLI